MINKPTKSLEETIKELQKRYKNVPSPLSENYQRNKPAYIPQQNNQNFSNSILGDFKPTPKQW